MSERKAVIKNADMSDEMQTDAIDCAANVRVSFMIIVVAPLLELGTGLRTRRLIDKWICCHAGARKV
jgi:hypothetical protein